MPFDSASRIAQYKVPNLQEAGPNVFFYDVLGSQGLTGSFFLLEGPEPSTAPKYTCDEVGIVLQGELTLKDESGKTASFQIGDTFFIHDGSTITFSTSNMALSWKCANRPRSNS